jgi:DNA-binding winged helix-turn-helix (wHTH) protein
MGQNGTNGGDGGRCWRFASVIFDESARVLRVDGQVVALEVKPMELLRVLVARAGAVVTKQDLLDAVWGDVAVVEASLPTAMRKLRVALGDDDPDNPIIATVARVGYRLAVPVERVAATPGAASAAPQLASAPRQSSPRWRWTSAVAALAAALGATIWLQSGTQTDAAAMVKFSQTDAENAVRRLDLPRIEQMLAAGWNPDAPFDDQGNSALNILLERCEWDPGHDRDHLTLVARTLADGGVKLTRRNIWGDTAYSIAKAPRYCGPDHPVTVLIRKLCTGPDQRIIAGCGADYAGAKRQRAAQAALESGG